MCMKTRFRRRRATAGGFTIVEVVVAMVLVGIFVMASMSSMAFSRIQTAATTSRTKPASAPTSESLRILWRPTEHGVSNGCASRMAMVSVIGVISPSQLPHWAIQYAAMKAPLARSAVPLAT